MKFESYNFLDEDERTEALIDDVRNLRGRACKLCSFVLCGHQAVISIVMGFKNEPHCISCLAKNLGNPLKAFRERIFQYVKRHECFLNGWMISSDMEESRNKERPECLWDLKQEEEFSTNEVDQRLSVDDDTFDCEWDAGDMSCGDLVLELRLRLNNMNSGEVVKVRATDSGAPEDIPAWCGLTKHGLKHCQPPHYWIKRRKG